MPQRLTDTVCRVPTTTKNTVGQSRTKLQERLHHKVLVRTSLVCLWQVKAYFLQLKSTNTFSEINSIDTASSSAWWELEGQKFWASSWNRVAIDDLVIGERLTYWSALSSNIVCWMFSSQISLKKSSKYRESGNSAAMYTFVLVPFWRGKIWL